jgi:hypothetical protein
VVVVLAEVVHAQACQQSKSFTKSKILLHAKPLVKIIAFDVCKLLHLDVSQNLYIFSNI